MHLCISNLGLFCLLFSNGCCFRHIFAFSRLSTLLHFEMAKAYTNGVSSTSLACSLKYIVSKEGFKKNFQSSLTAKINNCHIEAVFQILPVSEHAREVDETPLSISFCHLKVN